MKLLDGGRAPNPRRVRVFLAEKGIELPLEQVDISKMEHKTGEFTGLNPVQRVPVLVLDDGTAIGEVYAIWRFFEETHPEPPLMGVDPLDKAIVDMWNSRLQMHLLIQVAQVFRHAHPAMAEMEKPQVPEWSEANKPRVYEALAWLNEQLKDNQFVAGERYTIADISAMIAIDFLKPARLAVPEDHTALLRWYEEVKARPSAKA